MLKRKAIKMMVATDKVIGFETNPYKQTCRDILKGIIVDELGHKETITGASLCGASAEFEKQIAKEMPQALTYCIENNKQTAKISSQNMPKGCKLVVDDWNNAVNNIGSHFLNWMWADFCCNPTVENCKSVYEQMYQFGQNSSNTNPKVYAVTFDIGCRGISGGSKTAILRFLDSMFFCKHWNWEKESKRIDSQKSKTKELIKYLVKYFASDHEEDEWDNINEKYMPHTVIYYGGGKNKNNPCVPMLTMIYCLNDKYKITNQRWSWKREAGYEVTKFINLFDVKNGKAELTTNEGELKMKVKNVVKVIKAMQTIKQKSEGKSPVMISAGHKAWETRRKNEQKRKQSAAGHKAWETRRKNELAWLK